MSRLSRYFQRGTSALALRLAASGLKRNVEVAATRRVKKGKPFGRYIAYEKGPVISHVDGTTGKVIRQTQSHSFLHATKGWRTYNRIPAALLATAPGA